MLPSLILAAVIVCSSPPAVDGDGLLCGGRKVRLWGIDAPELHGRSHAATYPERPPLWVAVAARRRLANLARGKVICEPTGRSYDRVVAVCRSRGLDLGRQLVSEGLAVEWRKFSHGAYAAAELQARRARRGVWEGG